MAIHWIFSSPEAWEQFGQHLPGQGHYDADPAAYLRNLAESPDAIGLVADVSRIDDCLGKAVTDFQRAREIPVGILPYCPQHSESFERHFQAALGAEAASARMVLYSLDSAFRKDLARMVGKENGSQVIVFDLEANGKDIAEAVKRAPATSFAGQASGRQTFIQIGVKPAACFHPDLNRMQHEDAGAITPRNSTIDHLLLQSCHSPFVWPDFGGDYLSVPMAFMAGPVTRSFIASTRVQSLVPGLIPLYHKLAGESRTTGEIVLALNALARDLGIEDDPFILFGNPAGRIVAGARAEGGTEPGIDGEGTKNFLAYTKVLARNVENLAFVASFFHSNSLPVEEMNRFVQAVNTLRQEYEGKLRRMRGSFRFRAARDAVDLAGFATGLLGKRGGEAFGAVPRLARKFWEAKHGFYYYFSDFFDEVYLPDGCGPVDARCLVCESALREKRLWHGGIGAPPDYKARMQESCPRCLVTTDCAPAVRESCRLVTTHGDEGFTASLEYTNPSSEKEWVFVFAKLNDPNNISARLPEAMHHAVAGGVKLVEASREPQIVEPGGTVSFTFQVSDVPAGVFYLLLEVNLFVDGCWNWFGITRRSSGLAAWTRHDLYQRTLPHKS